MKKLLFIFIFFVGACGEKPIQKSKSHLPEPVYVESVLDNESWHLQNRIPDCDSAFIFMGKIIIPVKSELTGTFRNPYIKISIAGETYDNLRKKEGYKFYINPTCFVGKTSKQVLQMLCKPEALEDYLKLDTHFQKRNSSWFLGVKEFGNSMTLVIEDGVVIRASFSVIEYSH